MLKAAVAVFSAFHDRQAGHFGPACLIIAASVLRNAVLKEI